VVFLLRFPESEQVFLCCRRACRHGGSVFQSCFIVQRDPAVKHAHRLPPQSDAADWSAARDRPVIWTISVSRLSRLLRDITPEFDHRAQIETINLGFEEAVSYLQQRLRTEDCDVLIAAGSNGAYLRSRIDKPLMLIRPGGFDLMQALSQAHRLSPKIGLVTHETEVPVFAEFQASFGLSIEQRAFVTAEDARMHVAELVAKDCRAIVGTGMVVDFAEQAGVAGIMLYSADTIRSAFESALDIAKMVGDVDTPRRPRRPLSRVAAGQRYSSRHLLGDSPAMQALRERIVTFGAADRTVLITGDTGTGKELVAQALHAASPRQAAPFIAINCGAVAESLLESELFGYDDGAFTGSRRGGRVGLIEAAQHGTLFLDEIGEMPLALQTRLLRVLEEREVTRVGASRPTPVDLRVIAATHCDLDALASSGGFRRDLFYRLNVLRLRLPALRDHADDIAMLAQAFLRSDARRARDGFDPDAIALLCRYRWPGNVRELRNVVERAAVLAPKGSIGIAVLAEAAPELLTDAEALAPGGSPLRRAQPDRASLQNALLAAGGDRRLAAERLGVSRTTLWRWLREA